MASNDKLKEIDIKNHTYCYFDNIVNVKYFVFDKDLLDKRSYENYLIHDVAYKTLYGAKYLRIILDKVDGYIKKYDGTNIQFYFILMKKMREFLIELDILLC